MNIKVKWGAQLCVVGLCALGLKAHYSIASPDQLRWILWPTTSLVELLSGRSFSFESHAGYMSSDHMFLIAASCAGVNFMIASFLMLSLKALLAGRRQPVSWRLLPITASVAYATTIVANTVRICIALEMQRAAVHSELFDAGQLHRLEGILVYFAFLVMLYLLTETRNIKGLRGWLKRLCFPLGIYYATTLLLPLLNVRQSKSLNFWEHSLFVVLVPLALSLLVVSVCVVSDFSKQRVNTKNGLNKMSAESVGTDTD